MTGVELRASILQAAVQGKLVPQNPTDEPASVLLERIREERRALVKAKKAKAPKGGESVITRYSDGTVWEQRGESAAVDITDEVPFDVPEGWEWARFSSMVLGLFTGPFGSALHKEDYVREGIPVINPADIVNGHVNAGKMVSSDTRDRLGTYVLHTGDFVIARRGEMGRIGFIGEESDGWLCGTGCFYAHMYSDIPHGYWLLLFSSPYAREYLAGNSVGTTMSNLNLNILGDLLVPVPPLAEQERIVVRFDEVMPLAERYDRLDRERAELNAGVEGAMRASVLQAAVQGRLTERENGDEPASELLERIREERRALVKAKKAKAPRGGESVIWRASDGTVWEQRGKGKAVDITDEVPFDIPDGWEWARLGDVTVSVTTRNKQIKTSEIKGEGRYPVVSQSMSLIDGYCDSKELLVTELPVVLFGDHTRVVKYIDFPFVIGADGTKLHKVLMVNPRYLYYCMSYCASTIPSRGYARHYARLSACLFSIPPLAEQRRIVAKLDEMLPKVERLGELAS